MPQDLVRDASYQPNDPILRVQRLIFVHMYGEKAWTEDTFQGERDDCRLLALQFRDLFKDQWTPFTAAELLTNVSCELLFGSLVPNTNVRNVVREYAQSYLEDLQVLFTGDGKVRPEFQPVKGVQ